MSCVSRMTQQNADELWKSADSISSELLMSLMASRWKWKTTATTTARNASCVSAFSMVEWSWSPIRLAALHATYFR